MTIPTATLEELKRRAREVSVHAHAPYSGFRVGAAARRFRRGPAGAGTLTIDRVRSGSSAACGECRRAKFDSAALSPQLGKLISPVTADERSHDQCRAGREIRRRRLRGTVERG